jgi:hypothetical protein
VKKCMLSKDEAGGGLQANIAKLLELLRKP